MKEIKGIDHKYSADKYPPVRELTLDDREKLSKLIKLFAERSGNTKLMEMLPGQKKKVTDADTNKVYDLIQSVLQSLLDWVKEDVTAWFMDLIGVTDKIKYMSLPFDIEVYIIDQLIAQEGFNNFFSRASALYKKIRG